MRFNLTLFCLLAPLFLFAQGNTKNGVAAKGYDVVAYFSNNAVEGKSEFQAKHEGVIYKFSSAENQALFTQNPEKYAPQYGGWCAYAMGQRNKKVDIDPETYEIRDGKLFLFYNSFFMNKMDNWLEIGPEKLMPLADKNWAKFNQ